MKQGLYPLRAPLGYVDQGKGMPKTIDPIKGPLVRKTFELYGSAQYSFETLGEELQRLGLHNRNGGRVTKAGLTTLLNNSFYIGLIHIQKTGESFIGIHEPLIGKALFDRVHAVLTGRIHARSHRHTFQFRRMLSCATCHYSLVGERQKGNVYYRCHSKHFPRTAVREETVETGVARFFEHISFDEDEKAYLKPRVMRLRETWTSRREEETRSLNLRNDQIKDRLNRLTDAYLDQALDKIMFEERKKSLLFDQKAVEENLANLGA